MRCGEIFPFVEDDFKQLNMYDIVCQVANDNKKLRTEYNALLVAFNNLQTYVTTHLTDITNFNLTNIKTLTVKSTVNVDDFNQVNVKLALNEAGTIYKLYGYISVDALASDDITIIFGSDLRPTEEYTISDCLVNLTGGILTNNYFTVKTNGDIELHVWVSDTLNSIIVLPACLYFNTNFNDIPDDLRLRHN